VSPATFSLFFPDEVTSAIRETITRPRDESQEEKKARKQAVKADRQARRKDKKATKEQFSSEAMQQIKGIVNKEKTRMRKL
jgi:protein LTV1